MAKDILQKGWRGFLTICQEADSTKVMDELMQLYLTPEEREAVATRYLIVDELLKGEKTQREMAKVLNVSIAKITRGSNMLKQTNESLKKLLREKHHV